MIPARLILHSKQIWVIRVCGFCVLPVCLVGFFLVFLSTLGSIWHRNVRMLYTCKRGNSFPYSSRFQTYPSACPQSTPSPPKKLKSNFLFKNRATGTFCPHNQEKEEKKSRLMSIWKKKKKRHKLNFTNYVLLRNLMKDHSLGDSL